MIGRRPTPPAVLAGGLALLVATAAPAPLVAQDGDDDPPPAAPERPRPPDRPERLRGSPSAGGQGGRLGIQVEVDDPETGDGVSGVRVRRVLPGSGAEEGGLEEGDLILALDGENLSEGGEDPLERLLGLLAGREVGDVVEILYLRDGERRTTGVELGRGTTARFRVPGARSPLSPEERERIGDAARRAREEAREAREEVREEMQELRRELERVRGRDGDFGRRFRRELQGLPGIRWMEACRDLGTDEGWMPGRCVAGLEVRGLDPELGSYFGTDSGVLVLDVSESADLDLRPGDVVLRVDGRDVEEASDLRRILRSYDPGEPAELRILREGEEEALTILVP